MKFKKHPTARDGESEPNVTAVIVLLGSLFVLLIIAALPFIWQLWRAWVMSR